MLNNLWESRSSLHYRRENWTNTSHNDSKDNHLIGMQKIVETIQGYSCNRIEVFCTPNVSEGRTRQYDNTYL